MTQPWISDLNDGTYQNPVLFADYSDPDAVRLGDDYYLTASSFSSSPGLPILHSRDLVNWTLINHALPQLVPVEHFRTPRHGEGVWAPALRHHDGKFWLYYPDPDFGIYLITATDPAGAWSEPVLVLPGRGLIDPCPWWDESGHLFLVHGWARSRAGFANRLTLVPLTPDGLAAAGESRTIIDGDALENMRTLEGPKLYSRHGYVYIFAPANGVAEGQQFVFRARSIEGPYEHRMVLAQGNTPVNGPHQGAWVDTPAGDHWFLHFQERQPYGRIMHLQPMRWRDDDWPVMGDDPDGDGLGVPVLRHAKPALPAQPLAAPPSTDLFATGQPGLQWQWNANPSEPSPLVSATPGRLRLRATPLPSPSSPETADSLYDAPNLLLQKFPAPAFSATTTLDFSAAQPGEAAGLIVYGYSTAWIGLRRDNDGFKLVVTTHVEAHARHTAPTEVYLTPAPAADAAVRLQLTISTGGHCRFAYAFGDGPFIPLDVTFSATEGRWVGARHGLFASAPAEASADAAGIATFSPYLVTPPAL